MLETLDDSERAAAGKCLPREESLLEVIAHAVAVLEKTKKSFKSKELGELRRSLVAALAQSGAASAESARL